MHLCFAKKKLTSKHRKETVPAERERGQEEQDEAEESDEDDYEALTARNDGVLKRRKAKSERGVARFSVGLVVVVRNLPPGAREGKIRRKCERCGTVEDISFPASPTQPNTAYVTFAAHRDAREAVKKLNNSRYSKRNEEVLSAVLLSRENKSVSGKTLNKSRVLARNISFKSDEKDIRNTFEKFGTVLDVHIPRKDNGRMLG